MRCPAARSGESGFAMLFVFAMAAAVAFLIYRELPRIAFERQREKEQLLIERGEQYRRAIQLYVRKFNRYPAQLRDLENTNNIRFLRRRYKDPMTDKDEWRLIHIGPNGVLTNSLLSKPEQSGQQKAEESLPGESETPQGPQPVIRRRASEMPGFVGFPGGGGEASVALVGGGEQQGAPGPPPPPLAQPYGFQQPGSPYPGGPQAGTGAGGTSFQLVGPPQQPVGGPAFGLVQPGQSGSPGLPQIGFVPVPTAPPREAAPGQPIQITVTPVQPGAVQGAQQPAPLYPTQNVPGLPAPYGQPGVPSIGAITIVPGVQPQPAPSPSPAYSTQPGVGGAPVPGYSPFPQPGLQPVPSEPVQNPALQLIRELLTRPRPGGLEAIQRQQQQAPTLGAQVIGGGIAGVASTLEAEAIMVYNGRSKYNEWEFVYDFRKDPLRMRQLGLPAAGASQMPGAGQQGSQGQPAPSPGMPGGRRR
ncbi:MAG: hypothetical protein RMI94_07015 [Bryobacterales bacterium]|nr:hypothetical protein [Bryobacteraceae bacterium]MDW8130283.1 hypothetical protein [Bryobacterales bacterium]